MHVIDLGRNRAHLLLAMMCVLISATVIGETRTGFPSKELSIEGVSYCRPDNELILAHVTLVFRVTNGTERPLIFSRNVELKAMAYKQPSSSKFQSVHFDRLDNTGAANFDLFSPEFASNPAHDKSFAIVERGQSLLLKVTAPVPLERAGIVEGKFVLSFWPYSGETATRLRNKWSQYGDLLTDDFQSEPLRIVIKPPDKVDACSPSETH